ncbi:hypothetical protein OROMI_027140 [Orobanche minor]
MAENIDEVLKKKWYVKDVKALTSQLREHESLLRLKRRWLMDLPLSVTEQKRVDELLSLDDKVLPESLIREDDVSYEDIRTCIEMGFGARKHVKEQHSAQEDVQVFNSRDCFQDLCFLLDDMTNKGLCSLLNILTGGMIKYEKTNLSMKRTIEELLPKVISDTINISKTKLKQVFQLLKDPNNFRGNQIPCLTASEAYRAAAISVLDGLEDFPMKALLAMRRKLKGVRGYVPSLQPAECGLGRDKLITIVKEMCMEMLLHLGEGNEPSKELAGALGVAGLRLKLILNRSDVRDFRRFSPEIESLQNSIAKAIHLLNHPKKVSLIELRKLQLLVDPNCELSVRSLRTAMRNLLTEYLYECSDMDKVPDSLVETVDIINRRSQLRSRKKRSSSEILSSPGELMKEVIQKELEHVLIVSAQAKEVVLNLLPEHEYYEGFANAYVEDYKGSNALCISDDGDVNDDQVGDIYEHCELYSCDSYGQTEGFGETGLVNSDSDEAGGFVQSLSCKESRVLGLNHNDFKNDGTASCSSGILKFVSSDFPETDIISQQIRSCNHYLEVQEACDATTMVAYRFVGHVLGKLAKIEDLELYQGDRLYLQSHSSVPDDSEESPDALSTSKFSGMWKNVIGS